ncbi:MAG: hypothetical protein V5B44_24085 [Candidatus Accumulibacter necessarius]|uniref:hypothetical protein n=1 Tax=Candidatus Accumulibacter necessarius TaxID=2954386 RepID=UPI002FC343ED
MIVRLDLDEAAVFGGDLLRRREAGAEVAAAALGGVEGLEDLELLGVCRCPARCRRSVHLDAAEARLAGHGQLALAAAAGVHRLDGIVDQRLEQRAQLVRRSPAASAAWPAVSSSP